mmetsp:Transcript_16659/g.45769  ORF Transcript_16659/g.45769 Transcript_16659/m.45769 type:complete len:250 (+) Transcript_16659:286-1035(+)
MFFHRSRWNFFSFLSRNRCFVNVIFNRSSGFFLYTVSSNWHFINIIVNRSCRLCLLIIGWHWSFLNVIICLSWRIFNLVICWQCGFTGLRSLHRNWSFISFVHFCCSDKTVIAFGWGTFCSVLDRCNIISVGFTRFDSLLWLGRISCWSLRGGRIFLWGFWGILGFSQGWTVIFLGSIFWISNSFFCGGCFRLEFARGLFKDIGWLFFFRIIIFAIVHGCHGCHYCCSSSRVVLLGRRFRLAIFRQRRG